MNISLKHIRIALAVIIVAAILVLAPVMRNASLADLMRILPDSRGLAGLVLFLVFCAKAVIFIIPLTLLYLAAGIVFPPLTAVLFTAVCLAVEMTIGYLLGQQLGEQHVKKLLSRYKAAGKITEYIRDNSFLSVFTVRLIPGPPPDLVSMLLGAAKIKYLEFLTASLLGLVPVMVPVVLIGNAISDPDSNGVFILVGISVLMLVGAFFLSRTLLRRFQLQEQENNP